MCAGFIIMNKDLVYKRALWRVYVLEQIAVCKDAPGRRVSAVAFCLCLIGIASQTKEKYANVNDRQKTKNKLGYNPSINPLKITVIFFAARPAAS